MKNGKWLLIALFTATIGGLDLATLAVFPDHEQNERESATYAEGALRQRILMMRDAHGRIPPDAFTRAKAQADRLRALGRARRNLPGAAAQGSTSGAATTSAATAAGASWRWLGPGSTGGRIRTIAIHPTNPNVIFIGSAGGGIWKSIDAGTSWAPCDDFMPALSVSSIVFDPNDPNVIYAATGEVYHNSDAIAGAGIFKSADGGATWSQLRASAPSVNPSLRSVSRLAFSPDGAILLVATQWGIYRSTDGGASFASMPAFAEFTQVAFSPTSSTDAVATGYVGGVIYSRDGGQRWSRSAGFESVPAGARIELAYSKSDGSIYASVDMNSGALFRSFDGGASFAEINPANRGYLGGQGWYNNVVWVNPSDGNNVIVGGMGLYESQDGGMTLSWMDKAPLHVDNHVVVADPRFDDVNNMTVYVGNDGGLFRTTDVRHTLHLSTGQWESLNNGLGITQFYGMDANVANRTIVGGTQDNSTQRYVNGTYWQTGFGGDSGFVSADQTNGSYFYMAVQYASPYRSSDTGYNWQSIGYGINDGYATNFIAPVLLDPNNRQRLYVGKNNLWRTETATAGQPQFFSVKSGTGDYISAVTVQAGDPNVIWVGHNSGLVYRTTNGTSTTPAWTLVNRFQNYVSRITINPANPNEVFVTRTGFQADNVWRTTDGGATWTAAGGSGDTALPDAPVYDLEIDPANPGTLYVGSEIGVFTSTDSGATWDASGLGPANTRVTELCWMGGTLLAATHGRGVFALDVNAPSGAPAVSLNPSSLTFTSQVVGTTSAPQAMEVANSGTAPLTVGSVWIDGSNPADFAVASDSCTGVAVPAGASCIIQVTFRPSAIGSRGATLRISDNASGSPHTASLSGSGADVPATLPSPWSAQDIGPVGVAGSSSYSNGTFGLSGSGADVWNTEDAFQFAYQRLSGDGAIVARVANLQAVAAWTKAGVMIRQALTPDAAHAFMIVSGGKGLAFQRRTTSGGLTTSTSGIAGSAPQWVRVARSGSVVTASYSGDGTTWTTVGQDTIDLGSTAYVGLVISSHDNSQLATATFDQVSITTTPPPATLPSGWATADVGSVGATGGASASNGTFTVSGAGADIWGAADAFRYAYYPLAGDGAIVARVNTIEYVAAWTKAGVMLRQSLAPESPHAFMLVSAGKGIAFQRRTTQGGLSTSTSAGSGTAPSWVKLVRAGQVVSAYTGADGGAWTLVARDTIGFSGTIWAGLAVSSHDASTAATATFDNVSITATSTLPAGWQDADIGNVGVRGSATASGGTFTIKAAGADIWGTADAFHYAYMTLAGDGEIVARVASVEYAAAWTKAGVMIRGSLDPSAAQAFMLVSAGKGIAFQRRVSAGGLTTSTSGGAGTAPAWVRLVRSGSVISAYTSGDGGTWTLVAQDTFAMSGAAYVGLAVSSHDTTRLATATFDGIAVR